MPASNPHATQALLTAGPSPEEARATLILLHGRGASAQSILSLYEELALPDVAALAPQAANHTWYPNSFLAPIAQNEPWLSSAIAKVRACVESVASAGIGLEFHGGRWHARCGR